MCNHVLEHVQDDRKVMKEFYRVIKKGGWGIFQVPIDINKKKPSTTLPLQIQKKERNTIGKTIMSDFMV